jgi:hypothetical protein
MSGTGGVNHRLLILGLVVLLAIPLALVLRDVVREMVLTPLLYVLWFASLLLRAIHQAVFWGMLLVIVLSLAVTSLTRREKLVQKARDVEPGYPGRVRTWAQLIHLMERGDYSRWYVAQRLRRLILEILAYHEHVGIEQIKQYLKTGALDISPEVQACLQAGLEFSRSHRLLSRIWYRLRPSRWASPAELDLESVVQFLEDQLKVEVQYDHRSRSSIRSD